jgi:hypothetical protein
MKKIFIFLTGTLLVVIGCQIYTPQPQLMPQHVRKIAIRPFVNETIQYGLEEKLTLRVVDEFVRDGRYTVVKESDADGVIVGRITHYILQPLTYGENFQPLQYKLRVLLSLYFIDKVNNVTLWEEPNLEGIQIYTSATLPGGITEEEARELIWQDLSQKILTRTVEGFGSVAGVSEKKVPQIQQPSK